MSPEPIELNPKTAMQASLGFQSKDRLANCRHNLARTQHGETRREDFSQVEADEGVGCPQDLHPGCPRPPHRRTTQQPSPALKGTGRSRAESCLMACPESWVQYSSKLMKFARSLRISTLNVRARLREPPPSEQQLKALTLRSGGRRHFSRDGNRRIAGLGLGHLRRSSVARVDSR